MPKTHANNDKDFRQEAVNLLLGSGRPPKRVAAELGVSANSLRSWRDRALGNGGAAPFADAAGEIRRLQREVDYLRRQREIWFIREVHAYG